MIVFDASPLILLARTELLEGFLTAFPEPVVIPPAVQVECCENKESFDAKLIAAVIKDKRITVRKLTTRKGFEQIRREFNLGIGEAEAIALARAIKAGLIAIEDRNGVNACKILKQPFTGVLGIVLRMHEKGLIEREQALRKLDILSKIGRYRAEIIQDVRQRLEAER